MRRQSDETLGDPDVEFKGNVKDAKGEIVERGDFGAVVGGGKITDPYNPLGQAADMLDDTAARMAIDESIPGVGSSEGGARTGEGGGEMPEGLGHAPGPKIE